jgi:hypothetical protein
MLYREIIAVCSQIHTKHIKTLCEPNVELLNVKSGGKYSNYWDLNGLVSNSFSTLNKYLLLIFYFKPRYDVCIAHLNLDNFLPSRNPELANHHLLF